MPDEFSGPGVPSEIEEPPLSTELAEDEATPETPADLVTAAPEVLADSLGDYLRAQWRRIKSGESGALPVVAGLIIIVIFFQAERSKFGSADESGQPVRPGVDLHPARGRPDIRPDPVGDRPVGRLRARRRWDGDRRVDRSPGQLPVVARDHLRRRCDRGNRLPPGEPDHEAPHSIVRRHACRPAVLRGDPDRARHHRQAGGRRRDLGLDLEPRLQAGQRQPQRRGQLDRPSRGARDIRGRIDTPRGAPPSPGAECAAAQHHLVPDRRCRGRRNPARLCVHAEPRSADPR